MKYLANNGDLAVVAITGTNTVVFGFDIRQGSNWLDDFLGFAIQSRPEDSEDSEWLPNVDCFKRNEGHRSAALTQGRFSSEINPIQQFHYVHSGFLPGHRYILTISLMYRSISSNVTTFKSRQVEMNIAMAQQNPAWDAPQAHTIFFNHGAAASQEFSARFRPCWLYDVVASTAGAFTNSATTLVIGDTVSITGKLNGTATLTGYSDGKFYTVSAITGSGANVTGFTLTDCGSAIVTTSGTTTGLMFKRHVLPSTEDLKWLSRGLEEGLLSFIRQCRGPDFKLRCAFYDLQHAPVLDELKAVAESQADVKLVYHAKETKRERQTQESREKTCQFNHNGALCRVAGPSSTNPGHRYHVCKENHFIEWCPPKPRNPHDPPTVCSLASASAASAPANVTNISTDASNGTSAAFACSSSKSNCEMPPANSDRTIESASQFNSAVIDATGLRHLALRRTDIGISHNKFVVVFYRNEPVCVWTGSTNITSGAFYGQSNVGHIVRCPRVARAFADYWADLALNPDKKQFAKRNDERAATTQLHEPREFIPSPPTGDSFSPPVICQNPASPWPEFKDTFPAPVLADHDKVNRQFSVPVNISTFGEGVANRGNDGGAAADILQMSEAFADLSLSATGGNPEVTENIEESQQALIAAKPSTSLASGSGLTSACSTPKTRRCTRCREPGHNSRSCKKPQLSEEKKNASTPPTLPSTSTLRSACPPPVDTPLSAGNEQHKHNNQEHSASPTLAFAKAPGERKEARGSIEVLFSPRSVLPIVKFAEVAELTWGTFPLDNARALPAHNSI
jgi:hypothetical protein